MFTYEKEINMDDVILMPSDMRILLSLVEKEIEDNDSVELLTLYEKLLDICELT